jgi:hypothetical protein
MPKSPKVRKESSKREREEGRTTEGGKTYSARVPEAKKEIKARKWIMK